MHLERGRILFTPSDLAVFLESEFAAWMDRWELERRRGQAGALPIPGPPPGVAGDAVGQPAPDAAPRTGVGDLPLFAGAVQPERTCQPDGEDDDSRLLRRKGSEHELAVLAEWRERGLEVRDMQASSDLEATRAALRERVPILYQALLRDADFAGRPDFLLLRRGEDGKAWHEPAEAKLARTAKPEHVLQLCAYADMLAALQDMSPPEIEIMLGDGSRARLRTDRFVHYCRRLRRAFLDFQRDFDPARMPHPGRSTAHGRWNGCAERIIAATDHLRGCAAIHRSQIRKLERAGIGTLTQLAALDAEAESRRSIPGIRPDSLARLATQARLQIESRRAGRLLHEVRRYEEPGSPLGLALLPPASPHDVFFDMEGHPLRDGQLEYLFGCVVDADGETQFIDWWALGREAERAAFEEFVDWLQARWMLDPTLHVYHYNAYEVAAVKRLMGAYGSREEEVDDLLRAEVFVDLYRIVRQGLVIGSRGYSLKDIEPLYRPARDGKVKTAEGCMAAFERWLDAPDGATWRDSAILRDIRDYNRADCESTRDLACWLREVQHDAGVEPASEVRAEPADGRRSGSTAAAERTAARQDLAARLDTMAREASDPEEARIATLLAHLLEFHRRESKPRYWKMFERHAMSDEELYDDPESLAGCERTTTPPVTAVGGPIFEYGFDPDQDTKIGAGDRCAVAGSERARVEVVELDTDAGRVRLRFETGVGAPPERLSLFLYDDVRDEPLRAAIHRYAGAWSDGAERARAVGDLLRRSPPSIAGHAGGPLVRPGEPLLSALARVVGGLQESTLCIQGPPGTGKTYDAAHVILELLGQGCRVGVTANSHKAILNLMAAVGNRAREAGVSAALIKVGGSADDPRIVSGEMRHVEENSEAGSALDRYERDREQRQGDDRGRDGREGKKRGRDAEPQTLPGVVVGGTAWCFARPEMERRLDWLFVDEAGQVSVANLVAAGLAARNLVLVGDQMQLAQPIQGSHPGESGQSALTYLLQGQATIPPDFGVFLDVTYRMHPDVCAFVSEAVYDGKLHADASTCRRAILPAGRGRLVRRGTGILWVPVEHQDNSQASDEEVEAVSTAVGDLLRSRYRDEDGRERELRAEDILVVAPYNMQVRRLERRLQQKFGGAPAVGSVDRFQGLEAPAVIVSMCASTLEDVPRGLEFLLSPNRINVAISRAQCLAVVVGSPAILASRCRSLEDMERLDLYCRLVEHSERQEAGASGAPA